ncbi:MAG: GNAT family N-acetyltransferase, partial [Ruminococcaceae bacterium]|nr:GNAT family N-acetyltransferase [Oscillospiraceae bacterium]
MICIILNTVSGISVIHILQHCAVTANDAAPEIYASLFRGRFFDRISGEFMIIEALNKRPDLLSEAESYCKEKWNKVSAAFSQVASASISAQSLPQTWLILGEDERIRGFYQLAEHDGLAHRTELSPFLCTLFIDPRLRGGGFSEMLLTHAKYEAARLGYERLYIATDHIGYYERFGFTEIGSDITEWGSAAKIYSCDTPCGLRFEVFSKQHPRSDQLLLELARVRGWNLPDNPAASLRMMKHCGFTGI